MSFEDEKYLNVFWPGKRLKDGTTIVRILKSKIERGWLYSNGPDGPADTADPQRILKLRMDMRDANGHMLRDKWWIVPFASRWTCGEWHAPDPAVAPTPEQQEDLFGPQPPASAS